jgi:hypothetical protein
MLSMYVSKQQNDWDEYLPYVLFAYRTAIHPSTNEVPFYLVYSRTPRLPVDLPALPSDNEETLNVEDYKSMISQKYKEIEQEIGYYNEQIKQKMDRIKNKEREVVNYKPGDLVWLYYDVVSTGKVKKLSHPWKGPYRIIEIVNGVNAVISEVNGKNIMTVHVSRLKKFITPRQPRMDLIPTDQEEDVQTLEYEVENILKDKITKEGRKYLVKWKGYTEPTWESEENLQNSQELLQDYLEDKNKKVTCPICGYQAQTMRGIKKHQLEHAKGI